MGRDHTNELARRRVWKIALGLFVLAALALLTWCQSPYRWTARFPDSVQVDQVIDVDDESGIPSGCVRAVFRLSQRTLDGVNRDGVRFLETGKRPDQYDGNPFGPWRETPGEINLKTNGSVDHVGLTIFGLYALGGCGNRREFNYDLTNFDQDLVRPGSFYTVTSNREGIIIVIPKKRLAAFMYFG